MPGVNEARIEIRSRPVGRWSGDERVLTVQSARMVQSGEATERIAVRRAGGRNSPDPWRDCRGERE